MTDYEALADYELLKLLGSGSGGLVYLAREKRTEELCAVKEFPAEAGAVQCFFRELSILFTLNHPNIIRIMNLVQGQAEKNYLVLEYAEGGSLRDNLKEDYEMNWREALGIVRQIAGGLEEAHRNGIVHCDLKPENVLVCHNSSGFVYKVTDLGVAIATHYSGRRNHSIGSPAYMAPEQFYDQSTPACDLYALGVILYELLRGQRPFNGPPSKLFTAHLRQQPNLRELSNDSVKSLVSDLLSKEPSARPSSAAVVMERIDELLGFKTNESYDALPRTSENDKKFLNFPSGALRAEIISDRFMPGALYIHAPNPFSRDIIWISDERSTDQLDLERKRLHSQFFVDCFNCASPPGAEYPYRLLGGRSHLYLQTESSPKRLFAHQVNVESLIWNDTHDQVFYADFRRLYCSTLEGRLSWKFECENYCLKPCLLPLPGGRVAVTSGPTQPSILILDGEGRLEGRIQVNAPVLALATSKEKPDQFQAVVLGLGVDEPAQLLSFNGTEAVKEIELGDGVYAANPHGDFISLHYANKPSRLVSDEGVPLLILPPMGSVLTDCWIPFSQTYACLETDHHLVRLKTFLLSQ
jgi:serine/threonine-protein kinase